MTTNKKQSSQSLATKAAEILQDKRSSEIAKSLAASVLAQSNTNKQTGKSMEAKASEVLKSDKYGEIAKSFAASIVAQSNKKR